MIQENLAYFRDELLSSKLFDLKDLKIASESAVVDTSRRLTTAIMKRFKEGLSKGPNKELMGEIAKSKGDITKVSYYKNAKISLNALAAMASKSGGGYGQGVLTDLETILDFMVKNKKQFSEAFKADANGVIQSFYISIVLTWLVTVNLSIFKLTKVKEKNILWNSDFDPKELNSGFFKRANEYADRIRKGSISSALAYTKKAKDSNIISNESMTVAGIVFGAIGGILLLIYFVRASIMYFLDSRVRIANWLRGEAYLAEIVAINNKKLTPEMVQKQRQYVDNIKELAEIVDADLSDSDEYENIIQRDKESLKREINISTKEDINTGDISPSDSKSFTELNF